MTANRKLMSRLLIALKVIQISMGIRYVLCELRLQPSVPTQGKTKSIQVSSKTYVRDDSTWWNEVEEYMDKIVEKIKNEKEYSDILNELKFSQSSQNELGTIEDQNFELRAFNSENKNFLEYLSTFHDSNPGFQFKFEYSGKINLTPFEKNSFSSSSKIGMRISENADYIMVLFMKHIEGDLLTPILFKNNFEVPKLFDRKKFSETEINTILPLLSKKPNSSPMETNKYYLVFLKNDLQFAPETNLFSIHKGEKELSNLEFHPSECFHSNAIIQLSIDRNKKFNFCIDHSEFKKFTENHGFSYTSL
jgi:hypothetical protein